ncbi:hypothetical protein AB9F35_21470 [Rhizobium leguminosarum]|uniref:hypothetical protein n=1 Tax=Rhizobium leguminosarum TaxID=384 RepID=UPI003F970778
MERNRLNASSQAAGSARTSAQTIATPMCRRGPRRRYAVSFRARIDEEKHGKDRKDDELSSQQILVKERLAASGRMQQEKKRKTDREQAEIAPAHLDGRAERHGKGQNTRKHRHEPGVTVGGEPSPGDVPPLRQRLVQPGIEFPPPSNEAPDVFTEPIVDAGFPMDGVFVHQRVSSQLSARMTSADFSAIM